MDAEPINFPVFTPWAVRASSANSSCIDCSPVTVNDSLRRVFSRLQYFLSHNIQSRLLLGADVVNDPAFSLQDEVQIIPGGAKIGYLVGRYYEEGLIPHYAYHHTMDDGDEVGFQHRLPIFTAKINILLPSVVSNNPQPRTIQSMYPLSRPQCLPQTVTCFKVKWDKKRDRLLARIGGIFGELFESNDFWFRGLSRSALTSTLAFFIPILTTKSQDNEFGPGIYTANKLEHVLDYCGISGTIMVFKSPNLRELAVWEPTVEEWNQLVALWSQPSFSGISDNLLQAYRDSDIIRGPISAIPAPGKSKSHFPVRSNTDQLVAVSYDGCKMLSKSLYAIIYLEY